MCFVEPDKTTKSYLGIDYRKRGVHLGTNACEEKSRGDGSRSGNETRQNKMATESRSGNETRQNKMATGSGSGNETQKWFWERD